MIGGLYSFIYRFVEEFTLRLDYPMPLTDYLYVLQTEFKKLVPEGSTECGVRIFARV